MSGGVDKINVLLWNNERTRWYINIPWQEWEMRPDLMATVLRWNIKSNICSWLLIYDIELFFCDMFERNGTSIEYFAFVDGFMEVNRVLCDFFNVTGTVSNAFDDLWLLWVSLLCALWKYLAFVLFNNKISNKLVTFVTKCLNHCSHYN